MTRELYHNEEKHQYELPIDDHLAKLEYKQKENKIYLIHTEVPSELEGQGIGSKLVGAVLEDIEKRDLKIVPWCPFVIHYLKEHPKWQPLLAENVKLPS